MRAPRRCWCWASTRRRRWPKTRSRPWCASCTLTLDVPQTPEAAEPFPLWHQSARALCDDMDATPVDDDGQPVTLHAFDAIGRDLGQLYRQLEALDLAAGSAAARRLFS